MWLTHRGNFDFGCFVHSPHFLGIRGITRLYFSSENPNPGVCVCWGVDYTATHLQICVMCQSPNSPLQIFWILNSLGQPSGLVIFKPSMKSSVEMLLWKLCSQAPKQIYGKVIYSERNDLLWEYLANVLWMFWIWNVIQVIYSDRDDLLWEYSRMNPLCS